MNIDKISPGALALLRLGAESWPEDDRVVRVSRAGVVIVRRESRRRHRAAMSFELEHLVAGRHVPNMYHVIPTARECMPAVVRKGNASNDLRRIAQPPQLRTGRHVPEANGQIDWNRRLV